MAYASDGSIDWSLGQDAWHDPGAIQNNQYASGINLSTRGGILGPRSPYKYRTLIFDNSKLIKTDYNYERTPESVWMSGKFQAQIPYQFGSSHYIITVVSGLIFRTDIDTNQTILMSTDIKLNQYMPRVYWVSDGKKIGIFDWPARPIIIDGEDVHRSDKNKNEIPIAVFGTYNQNRVFIANGADGFTAGDVVGNRATPDAPFTFEEILTPSGPYYRQIFSLSTGNEIEEIRAMGFIAQLDTSTGIGPLFVASAKQTYSYPTQQPRNQWSAGQFGSAFLQVGMAGQRAFTNLGSDLIFVDPNYDVYTFTSAREAAKKWANIPISREVNNFLKRDTELSRYAVVGHFDNRVFISANPYRVEALDVSQRPVTDYAHGGFVVLEVEALASFLAQGTPVWNGVWTGINPMEIQTVNNRCFIMSKDGTGRSGVNALYELVKDEDGPDVVRGNHPRNVRSIVYTKEFPFRGQDIESAFAQKRENIFTIDLKRLRGKVRLKIESKADHSNEWKLVREWKLDTTSCVKTMPTDNILNGVGEVNIPPIVFGDPEQSGYNPVTGEPDSTFTALQYRLTISADNWRIKAIKSRVQLVEGEEVQTEELPPDLEVEPQGLQCSPDWKIPETILCR